MEKGTVFDRLHDVDFLRKFRIEFGSIVWGEGELDIAPEALYEEAAGKAVQYQSKDRAALP
jgi:hypothetical protein